MYTTFVSHFGVTVLYLVGNIILSILVPSKLKAPIPLSFSYLSTFIIIQRPAGIDSQLLESEFKLCTRGYNNLRQRYFYQSICGVPPFFSI